MATRFGDLPVADPDQNMLDQPGSLGDYLALPQVASLHWPADVVERWLFDHAGNASFIEDYGHLDLAAIEWTRELVPAAQLVDMPTGASDAEFLASVVRLHRHYLGLRPQGIRDAWERHGTWLVPPILLSRQVLGEGEHGLQVVEGKDAGRDSPRPGGGCTERRVGARSLGRAPALTK